MSEETLPVCPLCGAPTREVHARDGSISFYGCTEFRNTGCPGRWYVDKTLPEPAPFVASCPECHQGLHKGIGRTGKPYCACFEEAKHASGQAIFFNLDGSVREGKQRTTEFACPECGEKLVLFTVQSGRFRGQRTFACFNRKAHADGRSHYWSEEDGAPAF